MIDWTGMKAARAFSSRSLLFLNFLDLPQLRVVDLVVRFKFRTSSRSIRRKTSFRFPPSCGSGEGEGVGSTERRVESEGGALDGCEAV